MKPVRPWRKVAVRPVFEHRLFRLEERRLAAPDGARRAALVLDAPDWLNVVAITAGGDMVFVRQWRYGTETVTLELPGGTIEPGELPRPAAERELLEETGYTADALELLATVEPNPAIQNNRCHLFLAHPARFAAPPEGDGDEEIEVVLVPARQVPELVRSGEVRHSLVLCALYHLALTRRSLAF